MDENLPRSNSALVRKSTGRPTLSLGNQDSNLDSSPRILNNNGKVGNSIEKIRTFVVWSIFNLIFLPFGLLCLYFSHKVSQFKMQNRYGKAKKWSRRTFVANIITTLLMCGIIITAVMLHYDYAQRNGVSTENGTLTTTVYIPWQPGR